MDLPLIHSTLKLLLLVMTHFYNCQSVGVQRSQFHPRPHYNNPLQQHSPRTSASQSTGHELSSELVSLIALCDPGACVNLQQKEKISSCVHPNLNAIYLTCTLQGSEECDQFSTRLIKTCYHKKLLNLPRAARSVGECINSIEGASLNCLKYNWRINSISPKDALKNQIKPFLKTRPGLEVEFS